MINEQHHNSGIEQRLETILQSGQIISLIHYLEKLSNKDFRTAGYLLGEKLLLGLSESVFWDIFRALTDYSSKAFLITLTKTICKRYQKGDISLYHNALKDFIFNILENKRYIDQNKFLTLLLPVLKKPEEFDYLLSLFQVRDINRMNILMRCGTVPAFFVLFKTMKHLESDKMLLRRCCSILKKKNDRLSYNMVSIVKSYFGLHDISGIFSLNIRPYELSYIDTSYQTFVKYLTKI